MGWRQRGWVRYLVGIRGIGGIDIFRGRGVEIRCWRCGGLEGIRDTGVGVIGIFRGRGVKRRCWRCGGC